MNSAHEESDGGGGFQPEVIKSYLAFAFRAVRRRRLMAAAIFLPIAILTVVAAKLWPRTYHCETVLMVQGNQSFEELRMDSLGGATEVVTRQEGLRAIVKETDLVKSWARGRSPLLRAKDTVMGWIRGFPTTEDQEKMLVGTLTAALNVTVGSGTLTLAIDWPEPEGAAKVVAAAQQAFLQSRHNAEVATLAEYISILEGHAGKVHSEIDDLAGQIQKIKDDRLAEVGKSVKKDAPASSTTPVVRAVRASAPRPVIPAAQSEEDAQAKETLEAKQRQLKELEDQRERRLSDLEAKKIELETRYTSAHPEVLAVVRNITSLSSPSSDEATLKQEVLSLKARQTAKSAAQAAGAAAAASFRAGGGAVTEAGTPAGAEPLSPEIMMLMQDTGENLDPALASQLRLAVDRYAMLHGKVSTSRVDLDTAQAAFAHRYQVVVPAEVPRVPIKPKVPVILGIGFLGGLLFVVLLCILAELRTGRLVEIWQIHQMGIPVLGELRLPPNSLE